MSLPTTQPSPKDLLLPQVASAAYAAELSTGFPALITLSQWAIESAWGAKPAPGNNYFGMKYASRHYSFYWAPTTEFYKSTKDLDYALSSLSIKDILFVSKPDQLPIEVKCQAKFAAFSSLSACIDDYIYLMCLAAPSNPYYKAFQEYKTSRDISTLALSISKIYATSPKYGELLLTLMTQSNIKGAIEYARQQAISLELAQLPPKSPLPNGPYIFSESTVTLSAFTDSLGSSYLFYREPYFYLCDPLPDGNIGPARPIGAFELGFVLPSVPSGPQDGTK